MSDDGWSRRATFAGDAEAFMAGKRAGVGLKPDPEEPPPAPPIPPPPMIRAEPRPEPPPPGLLADIGRGIGADCRGVIAHGGGLSTHGEPIR